MYSENVYKQWFITTIALTITIFLLFVMFNIVCSYRNERTTYTVLEHAAQTLLDGHMVAGLGDDKAYDDRLLQKLIIQKFKKIPDIALFGSSRSMPIRTESLEYLGLKSFFNHSLTSASIEDAIALLGIYQATHHAIPKTIIISIDPWIFNEKTFCEKWKSNGTYYKTLVTQFFKTKTRPNLDTIQKKYDYWRLISFSYTLQNIQTLGKTPLQFFIPTDTNYNEFIRDIDGSVYIPKKIREQPDSKTHDIIAKNIKYHVTDCARERISKLFHTDLFEAFIAFLVQKNSRVIFYLPAYHPDLYKFFTQNPEYSGFFTIETYLKNFAVKNKITILGSYNPEKYNLETKDFFDGIHGHDSCIKKVLQN